MRRTKPQFVVLGAIFIAIAVILSVILVVKALSGSPGNNTPHTVPTEAYHVTEPTSQATQTTTTEAATTISAPHPTQAVKKTAKDIVKLKGLTVDKDGNVTDSKGIKYKVVDGKVKIVYDGELYTIYLNTLKRSNTSSKDNKNTSSKNTSSKSNTSSKNSNTSSRNSSSSATSRKIDVKENTSSVTQSSNQNNNNNNYQNNVNNGSHSQSNNIVKPNGDNTPKNNDNVKLNYSSLTVKVTSIFSLSISGTNGKVAWNVADTDIVKCYQYGDTQCSFRSVKKGSTQVIATYNGKNYYCDITVN